MKDKWVGHMVEIVNDDPWTDRKGKVICCVREGRRKEYIVQFSDTWSWFRPKQMKLSE